MKIPIPFAKPEKRAVKILTVLYCLCILSATFIREMNYFNFVAIAGMVLYIFYTKKIRKSALLFCWSAYILAYPIIDAAWRGKAGLSLLNLLCYLVPFFFLFLYDFDAQTFGKIFLKFIKYFAWFQAFGIILQDTFERVFIVLAYRILGLWSYGVRGFTTDPTVAAYILCFGVCLYFVDFLLIKNKKSQKALMSLLGMVCFIIFLVMTTKRSFLIGTIIALLVLLIVYNAQSKRKLGLTFWGGLFFIGGVLLLCLVASFMGSENALGRLGETVIGLFNGEDVSSMRSTWAEYMHTWSEGRRLFGIGWESFKSLIYTTPYGGKVPNGHNVYLQISSESGYFGAAIYILLMAGTIVYAIRNVFILRKNGYSYDLKIALFALFSIVLFAFYCGFGNAIYDSVIYLHFFAAIKLTDVTRNSKR